VAEHLSRPAFGWLAVALGAEALSYLCYAGAQRRLLDHRRDTPAVGWLASLAVCAQSLSNFLPGGYVAANLLNFRALTRRGLPPALSARLLLASSGLYIGALACLTLVAAELVGADAGSWVRTAAAASLGAIAVAFLTARWLLRRGVLRVPVRWRDSRPLPKLSVRSISSAGILFLAGWLADAGCLAAASAAVGTHLTWTAMPIAYCGAQLVSFLPITPGGVGLVEGSLALTLAGPRAASGSVLAAVLVYRAISYWGTLPAGLLGYLAIRPGRSARSTSLSGDGQPRDVARPDRALGSDRPLLVLDR
jgi:uncharacterized membrane protein YbhN (UPF0104 family)